MLVRLNPFTRGRSHAQRLSDLEGLCGRLTETLGRLADTVQHGIEQQERLAGQIADLGARLQAAEAALQRDETEMAALRAEALRRHAGQPTSAALAEEMRSLRAAQAAVQAQVQAFARRDPLASEPLLAQLETLKAEVGRLSRFVLQAAASGEPSVPADGAPRPRLESAMPLSAQLEQLEEIVPRTFQLWYELLEHNRQSYTGFPVHSCSVDGHPSALLFTSFVNQFLRGNVLDVGCGPQPVPLYLQRYPADRVYGVDPISTSDRHPFHFYQGVAEFLPWNDASFDVVIAATSLDHVLFLDKALREIHRVLADEGDFLVWVAFVAGSAPYDPCDPEIQPVDEFHLFHFTEEFFEGAVTPLFTVKDKMRVNLEIDHHFYRLAKRVESISA